MSDKADDKNLNAAPEQSLLDTLARSDLCEIAADAGETLIDQLLSDGPLQDVPIFGILLKLAKVRVDITDYLFMRKLQTFLYHLSAVPLTKRQAFTTRISLDEKLRKRVGENLLLLLHRLDDMQKPELLSRAFRAYVEGAIDLLTYQRLGSAIDRVRVYNLPSLVNYYREDPEHKVADDETMQDLAIAGLINFKVVKGLAFGPLDGYEKNQLGRVFIQLILSDAPL